LQRREKYHAGRAGAAFPPARNLFLPAMTTSGGSRKADAVAARIDATCHHDG
jgi:hypothetical protein